MGKPVRFLNSVLDKILMLLGDLLSAYFVLGILLDWGISKLPVKGR